MAKESVWLITGANRGVGLEMVNQLLQSPSNAATIIAACRTPSTAADLQKLSDHANGRLRVVALDVANKASVYQAAEQVAAILGGRGVDYLINNAGILPGGTDTAFCMDVGVLEETFTTNVSGPSHVAQAFIGLVEKSAKRTIVNISSTLGSMGADPGAVHASYAVSKAALNMLTYKEAKEKPSLIVISMCPGSLQTDMGGESATYPVSVGVAGILKTVRSLKKEDSGTFFNFKGEHVPW
ncbi:NAD(P)-binding protein [Lentinus brumalis]|uniref:NAD(P)-binding protein n=1 Tax=Lentinus brumalis TaxID=2498619 RepID=A0A371CV73_9APHY|nr:NAD(P)-binding protein [Polyporus brumalis]